LNALFDLDGTLCDPSEGIVHGFRHAFETVGLPFPGESRVCALIGRPLTDCFRGLGCGAASAEAARHFQAFFEGRGHAEGRLYPGALESLQALKRSGWGAALASAKPTFAVRFVAADLGILPWLDGLYGCAAEDLNPDKTAIAAAALAGLGWKAADTVFIGDRRQDRDAASRLGMAFVAAAWGFGSGEEWEGADAVALAAADLGQLLPRRFAPPREP
jgi:phosphoglycolate phosphatase